MILNLSLNLPDDGAFLPLTRQLGRCLLEYLRVIEEDVGDVEVIVGELASNVIRHAQSADGRFQLLLEYDAARVVVTVVDAGQGFTFRDVPEIGSPRPDMDGGLRLGGFGLPILDALSDRLEFTRTDPHGTTVRAEKSLRYETRRDAENAEEMNRSDAGPISIT